MKLKLLHILFIAAIFGGSIPVFAQKKEKEFDRLDEKAFGYYEDNEFKKAEDMAYLILEKRKNKPASIYQINAYTLLGIINKDRGYYINALENNIKALNISEKIKDSNRVSVCLNNIGIIYTHQKNYRQAINYFNRSVAIEEKGKLPLQKSIRYYNLGDCYKELNKLDLALSYFNNSLLIEEKYQNQEGILYAYLGIAEVYLKLKNYIQARMVLDKISQSLDNKQLDISIIYYQLMGDYLLHTGKAQEALEKLKISEQLSIKNKINTHILDILLLEIDAFEAKNDIAGANRMYKAFIQKNEELTNSEIKNKIEDLTYQNELSKKELEIKLVKEERNLAKKNEQFEKNLRLYKQKITWFVVAILILAVGLVFFGIRKLTREKNDTVTQK